MWAYMCKGTHMYTSTGIDIQESYYKDVRKLVCIQMYSNGCVEMYGAVTDVTDGGIKALYK